MRPDYSSPPENMADEQAHRIILARAIKGVMQGKVNTVSSNDFTFTPNVSSEIYNDPRIGFYTYIGFQPLTANAAAALSTTWCSNYMAGSVTINHANNAQTDRTFRLNIVG